MQLVEASAGDLDALVERWYSLAKTMEAYDELNELDYAIVDDVPDNGFRAHLDDEGITDYLVSHEGGPIGFVTLRKGHHPSREYSHYLRLVNLSIDEGHRNRGHGAAVVEQVKKTARDRGCDHLSVSCEWQNEGARRFHREAGFRPKQVDYVRPLEEE